MPKAEERKLAAIMFADIVGYSRMMSTDEDQTLELLKDFEELSSPIVTEFQGKIIKKIGDEIFCEFNSSKNAVDAALKLQESISKYNDSRPKDFQLSVRIGIHIGDIVKRGDDIHGDGVNVASRIQPLASPGGICISSSVQDALRGHPKYNIIKKGEHEIKNILDKYSIFQVKTGYEKLEKISSTKRLFRVKYPKIVAFVVSLLVLFIVGGSIYYFNIGKKEKEDNISDNFYFYIDSRQAIIDTLAIVLEDELKEMGVEKVEVVSPKLLEEIWNEVPPIINTKLVHKSINAYMPKSRKEREQFYIFPLMDYYQELRNTDTTAYRELDNKLSNDFKDLDTILDQQHGINIDAYIVLSLARIKIEDAGWGIVYTLVCWFIENNGSLSWSWVSDDFIDFEDDPDDVNIKDKLSETIAKFMQDQKYGGTNIGNVDEVLSDDIVSIEITNDNINILKGNKLKAYRIYFHGHQYIDIDDEFDKELDDMNREIEYVKKNPLFIIETECKGCSQYDLSDNREYKAENIDNILQEYLKLTNIRIDSLKHHRTILKEPYLGPGTKRMSFGGTMHYTLDVIKITDTHIIAKIVDKHVPFLIPKVYDRINLIID